MEIDSLVRLLRYVFLTSGGLFGLVVLADKFGITIPSGVESVLIPITLSICMFTVPMWLTGLMPRRTSSDDDDNSQEG